jgi:hypothetical protein
MSKQKLRNCFNTVKQKATQSFDTLKKNTQPLGKEGKKFIGNIKSSLSQAGEKISSKAENISKKVKQHCTFYGSNYSELFDDLEKCRNAYQSFNLQKRKSFLAELSLQNEEKRIEVLNTIINHINYSDIESNFTITNDIVTQQLECSEYITIMYYSFLFSQSHLERSFESLTQQKYFETLKNQDIAEKKELLIYCIQYGKKDTIPYEVLEKSEDEIIKEKSIYENFVHNIDLLFFCIEKSKSKKIF